MENARGPAAKAGILFVDLGATFGGAEIYLLSLLTSLRHEVRCVVLCSNAEFERRLRADGIECYTLTVATGLLKPFQLVCAACVSVYLLVSLHLKILQINGYSEIVLVPVARMLGRKAIPTRHLSFDIAAKHFRDAPGSFIARSLYQMLAKWSTKIACVSAAVGKDVEAIAPGKAVVVPNWVDEIPPFTKNVNAGAQPMTVLYAGRLVEYKGVQVLLQALRKAQAETPGLPMKLIIVGDGPYRGELERMAKDLPVEFVGFQRDVGRFYDLADLFVSPSLGPEGSSLVALEAMAHSVPCIMSDLPVHREISRDGSAAVLFRSDDPGDLSEKLTQFAKDAALRERVAKAGHHVVSTEHTKAAATKAYLEIFA